METTSHPSQANSINEIGKGAAAEHAKRSIDEARASAGEFAARGTEALRSGAARAQEIMHQTTDQAAQYVQAKPLKALLIAAAAGAVIALMAGALSKHHGSR
ncbi:MAG: hypothetical protein IV085_05960 [Thiobacillus sp.]|nr:hypothetical protein [Thiobacillus sp.]